MRTYLILIILAVLAFSCKEDPREKFSDAQPAVNTEELMIELQKKEIKTDSILIEKYLELNKWNYSQTGTGLRYEIISSTELEKVQSGGRVILDYKMMNLKGEELYSSANSGVMDMLVDYSQAETGLHELLKQMRYGEEARAIIPFHLGHGFAGDDYKIPPFTSIVIELKVLT